MNTLQKKELATFMDFPTKATKGRITNLLADAMYNDISSLFAVIGKIEEIEIPDEHGNYKVFVTVSGKYCDIKISRRRENSGFKDGVFDEMQISYNKSETKVEAIQLSIMDFLNWYSLQ